LLGRSTTGRIHPIPELDLGPFRELDAVIDQDSSRRCEPTIETDEVARRLLRDVGPGVFEHLVVALLQLEEPEDTWLHVGGSGDGGVDAIRSNSAGRVTAVLQCKWSTRTSVANFGQQTNDGLLHYFATLAHPAGLTAAAGMELLDRNWIVERVIAHRKQLPWAVSMRIF